ncbi:MAG: ACT domain-containing protein [Chloroflexi bacterium]|nr:ACT domain-containing protein [Chloroflexota bacterium]
MANIRIGGMIRKSGLVHFGVVYIPGRPGTAGRIMQALGENGINVEFIVQLTDAQDCDHVVFCVAQADAETAAALLEDVRREIGAQRLVQKPRVAIVSIFGPDFRERPGIASAMFSALGRQGINIIAISTSISTLSCVIDADSLDDATMALHRVFELP